MAILQVNVKRNPKRKDSRSSQGRESQQSGAQVQNGGGKEADPSQSSMPRADANDAWQQILWRLSPGTPIGRALVSATQRLEEAGSPTAHLDAQVILAHVFQQDRSWLFAHYDTTLDEDQAVRFIDLVARRVTNEPVAYLVGHKEFYGLNLAVNHWVLIPRPETELLVDAVLDHIDSRQDKRVMVADVGTGSGAIALAVAANAPHAQVYALDISAQALAVTRQNVETHGKEDQVIVLESDLLAQLPQAVDIVAANLPYITSMQMETLEAGIREYEPHLALAGGADGLAVIERLLRQLPARLKPGGVVFMEIGSEQGAAALDLIHMHLPHANYVGLRQDYHGLDRLLVVGF